MTAGPRTPFLDKFVKYFDNLNNSSIDHYDGDEFSDEERADLINFIEVQLKLNFDRYDYKELLVLSKAFLIRLENFKIRKPSKFNHSRFMKQLSICIMMFLYRKQFIDTEFKSKMIKIRNFCIFDIKLFLKNWYQCICAPYVPLDDFNLFKNIFKLKNKELLKVCLKTFNGHKTYVVHKLIAFSHFDPRINNDQKQTFVNNINKKGSLSRIK